LNNNNFFDLNEDINPQEYNFDGKYYIDSIKIDISKEGIEVTKNYFRKDNGLRVTIKHKGKEIREDKKLLWDMLEMDLYDKK
jgi:hypothetical protein